MTCDKCKGNGKLSSRGGYHKKNPVSIDKIEGEFHTWDTVQKKRSLGWSSTIWFCKSTIWFRKPHVYLSMDLAGCRRGGHCDRWSNSSRATTS